MASVFGAMMVILAGFRGDEGSDRCGVEPIGGGSGASLGRRCFMRCIV